MNRKWKNIFRVFTLVLLLLFASVVLWRSRIPQKPASIPAGDYTYTLEYVDYRISQVMEQKNLPSFAVALVDDQEIIWQATFGVANLDKNQPAEPETVYRLWSVAKVFTALETLRLVEDGLVELDTPITDYIPGFVIQSRYPDPGQITIRSILTHRSGLPRNGCQWVELNPNLLADLVFSAEGSLDYQTPRGKIPAEIGTRAKKYGLPVIVLAGSIGQGAEVNYDYGIDSFTSILSEPCTLDEAIKNAASLLESSSERTMRMILVGMNLKKS